MPCFMKTKKFFGVIYLSFIVAEINGVVPVMKTYQQFQESCLHQQMYAPIVTSKVGCANRCAGEANCVGLCYKDDSCFLYSAIVSDQTPNVFPITYVRFDEAGSGDYQHTVKTCHDNGLETVVSRSYDELLYLNATYPRQKFFYGLNLDRERNVTMDTERGNSTMKVSFWYPGQPNGYVPCLSAFQNTMLWGDVYCNMSFLPFCQKYTVTSDTAEQGCSTPTPGCYRLIPED